MTDYASRLTKVMLDGKPTWKFACPVCGLIGSIDDDQFHGRVSIQCLDGCTFHETIDLSKLVKEGE